MDDTDDAQECRDEMRRGEYEWTQAAMMAGAGRTWGAEAGRRRAERSYVYALESLLAWVRV